MGIACSIHYNQNNEVEYVESPNGERSVLFDELRTLFGAEKALDLYALTESEDFKYIQDLKNKPIKFSILGEKGAQSLDQAEEVTFRMDNLLIAKQMEQAGKTPLEIRLATGWERGTSEFSNMKDEDIISTLLEGGVITETEC